MSYKNTSDPVYRIGVDASLLADQITGIGRYAQEILSRLVLSRHQWFLYSHRPLKTQDWQFDNVHLRTGRGPKRFMRVIWGQTALPMLACNDNLDLFWSPAHRFPYFLPKKIARVVTIHDLVWKHAPETMQPLTRWLDTNLMPHAVRVADCVIADSANTAKDVLAEMPYAQGKIHVVPLGVSLLTQSQSRESLNSLGLQNPFFLFVGTLEPRKNLARLLEAFSTLPEHIKNKATLAIAGGKGWGGVEIATIAEKLGIANRVRILGYVNDQQLATLYTHALFLAMPSLYEGFGLPFLEAMSRGTPVLTANCASMPEVAGDAGVLVNPHEIVSISDGLLRLLGDERYRKELVARSIQQAQLFSWEKAAQETMQIFESAIMSRRLK